MPKTFHRKPDYILLGITISLLVIGLVMMNSISIPQSIKNFDNTSHYILHQLFFGAGVGLIGMYVCYRFEYRHWRKFVPLLLGLSLVLLLLVKVPGIGFGAGGATRWIHIGPLFFQPAELAKLALILYMSGWISERYHKMHDFQYGVLPALAITVIFAGLILWQPDLGTMLVLVSTALAMLFLGGTKIRYFFWVVVGAVAILLLLIKIEPYRVQRLTVFLNRSLDPLGIGYQINQAVLAIGSGGLTGYGYNGSLQKWNYLPEAMGDSIFAVLAEELGFAGVLVILTLFLGFALRGIKISLSAPDLFGRMLAIGITTAITVQSLINIGAIVGLLPLTGVTLPFFSYGSSSLIITLCEVGILLNISKSRAV